jgi:HPt (histidine-containing phosphotransfer) domain-containing protein
MNLQRRYVAGLPARWAEIKSAADFEALRQTLHRLAGSAGSYGFELLGQRAREAEKLVSSGPSMALTDALGLLETEVGLACSNSAAQ